MFDDKLTSKYIAYAVRNSSALEQLHSGITPSSKTGDYSDVYVVTPYGKIEWNQLSRISDKEMRVLMMDFQKKILDGLKLLHQLNEELPEKESINFLENLSLSCFHCNIFNCFLFIT